MVDVELDYAGMTALRKSPEVQAYCKQIADRICSKANSEAESHFSMALNKPPYRVAPYEHPKNIEQTVYTASKLGALDNLKYNTLEKSKY